VLKSVLLLTLSGCLGIDISGHGSGVSGGTGAIRTVDAGTVEVLCVPRLGLVEIPDSGVDTGIILCNATSQPGFQPQTLDAGLTIGFIPASTPCSVIRQGFGNEAVDAIVIGCPKPYTVVYVYTDTDGYDVVFMPSVPDGG
jgi:hypothetical protein